MRRGTCPASPDDDDGPVSVRTAIAVVLVAATAVLVPGELEGRTDTRGAHPEFPVGGSRPASRSTPRTHTIYVGNGTAASLSVIDGTACNARTTHGCGRRRTATTGGTDPIGIAIEESTNTVYVVNAFGTLAVIDGRRCNGARGSGCMREPRTVPVGVRPQFLVVDDTTHTIYVANVDSNTVSAGGRPALQRNHDRRLPSCPRRGPARAGAVYARPQPRDRLALRDDARRQDPRHHRLQPLQRRRACRLARPPRTFRVSAAPGDRGEPSAEHDLRHRARSRTTSPSSTAVPATHAAPPGAAGPSAGSLPGRARAASPSAAPRGRSTSRTPPRTP